MKSNQSAAAIIINIRLDGEEAYLNQLQAQFLERKGLELRDTLQLEFHTHYNQRKESFARLERDIKKAISKINELTLEEEEPVALVFSSISPFDYDASLPIIETLLNSKIAPIYFMDLPEADVQELEILKSSYERRRKQRKRSETSRSSSTDNNELNSRQGEHLREEENRILSRRRKRQKQWTDENTQKAIRYLLPIVERQHILESREKKWLEKYAEENVEQMIAALEQDVDPDRLTKLTLLDLAYQLDSQNIKTPRFNRHSPKSVSRLKELVVDIAKSYRFPVDQLAMIGESGGGIEVSDNIVEEINDHSNKQKREKESTQGITGISSSNSHMEKKVLPISLKNIKPTSDVIVDFSDSIKFVLSKEVDVAVTNRLFVELENNLDNEDPYYISESFPWPAGEYAFSLDVLDKNPFLIPGGYLVRIFEKVEEDETTYADFYGLISLFRENYGLAMSSPLIRGLLQRVDTSALSDPTGLNIKKPKVNI